MVRTEDSKDAHAGGQDVVKWVFILVPALLLGAVLAILLKPDERVRLALQPPAHSQALRFAVLGDSDSHAYHDELNFGRWPEARGGALRQRSWQWTEVLAHLRAEQLDPGPWGVWGTRYRRLASLRDALGLDGRFPAKQDHRFNLAYSGAVCADLTERPQNQTARLLAMMQEEPDRWRQGVVLVRIGTNDFGGQESLEALSRDAADPQVLARIDGCVQHIGRSVQSVRSAWPQVRIVLVGVFNNAEWERFHAHWQSPQALARIQQGLARFDEGLKAIARQDANMAFFDDQAWFAARWGSRLTTGLPVYSTVRFGRHFEVSNTGGDEPRHATLKDGHAGTVWNALWAQELVALLNQRFALAIPPLDTEELVRFVDPDGRFGMQ